MTMQQQVVVQSGRQHGKNAARMEWLHRKAPDLYELVSQLPPEDQFRVTLFAGEDSMSILFPERNWRLTVHRQGGQWGGWVAEVHDLSECERHPEVYIGPVAHAESADRFSAVAKALRKADR